MVAALDSAIRAPSTHNTQPWIFGFEDEPAAITFHADATRSLAIADPAGRELFISCGTVLHHLRVALAARGRSCRIERLPDPADPMFVARVTIGAPVAVTEAMVALEEAIQKRHTDNGQFDDDEVDEALRANLTSAVEHEGASLVLLADESGKAHIADLVAVADRVQGSDSLFREELSQWLRSELSDKRDGMVVEGPKGLLYPWIVRTFDRGDGEAARDRALIADGSPVLAIIATATDTPMDWVRAGEALSALLLHVAMAGWSASYFAQVVEVDSTRAAIDTVCDGRHAQVVLRLGRGHHARKSARRPVRDMIRD
jgi:hypothetical protein